MGNFDQGRAKKSLGQHFLVDRSAIARIAAAIPEGASTLEIGPGRGAITESLLKRVGKLVLIEKDDDLAAMWQERAESEDRLTLVHGDVMQCLLPTVAGHQPAWIAGNLPYNISGPLSAALFSLHLPGWAGADVPARGSRSHQCRCRQQDLRWLKCSGATFL